jgi:hypothetical protein
VTIPLFGGTPAAAVAASPAATDVAPEAGEEEMIAAAEIIVACANEEPQALRYSVFTDRYLGALFDGPAPADQPAFERMIATGSNPGAGTTALEAVSGIEPLPDGRVTITLRIATPDGVVEDRLALAWDADQRAWLIDEVLSLQPPAATPTG